MDSDAVALDPPPSVFTYVLSFLLVGVAWGFTTPFIRRAAANFNARQEAQQTRPEEENKQEQAEKVQLQTRPGTKRQGKDENKNGSEDEKEKDQPPPNAATPTPAWIKSTDSSSSSASWLKQKITTLFWTVCNLLRTPAYSIPLVLNLSGSIWFFLLVGQHELSLTVPLANSSAFLFTVLGEWYVERKMIAKKTWLGLGMVLGGIALCVQSKA